MVTRKIVHIDEAKCDGCGVCVPSCAEGAIQIIAGKARLVADVYCDGLGACLGECPQGAISVIEREADDFDEAAVHARMQRLTAIEPRQSNAAGRGAGCQPASTAGQVSNLSHSGHGGCPGAAARSLGPAAAPRALPTLPQRPMIRSFSEGEAASGDVPPLANWPIQLHLVPPTAPFLHEADLLLVADCAAFAVAGFQEKLLKRRPLVIGCPKLDDGQAYVEKLSAMIRASQIRSLTVIRMEVPCCTGLVRIAGLARQAAGSDIPLEEVVVSIRGQILETKALAAT